MPNFSAYMAETLQKGPDVDPVRLIGMPPDARANVLVTLPSPEAVGGSRFCDTAWIWPESMYPGLMKSQRQINFKIPVDLASGRGHALLNIVKIYLLSCMFYPFKKQMKLQSLRKRQRYLCEFIGEVLQSTKYETLAAIDPGTYHALVEGQGKNRITHARFLSLYLEEMREYGRRGILFDYPGMNVQFCDYNTHRDHFYVNDMDNASEKDINVNIAPSEIRKSKNYEPLSDIYLSEMGRRCIFYLKELGPNLVRFLNNNSDQELIRSVWLPPGREAKVSAFKKERTQAWKDRLTQFEWLGTDGEQIKSLPFACDGLVFPPTSLRELQFLASRHQDALVHILLLLTGGRKSEIITMERDVVREGLRAARAGERPLDDEVFGEHGLVVGRSTKPSARARGDKRVWPLPIQVLEWLDSQSTITTILGNNNGPYLWNTVDKQGRPTSRIDLYGRCIAFTKRHHIDHLLDGDSQAHPHRFRKSIARIALLSLTGAPAIVMQMFGHRDIMTTLQYLLSDRNIREDLRIMLGERRTEIAVEIAQQLDDSVGAAASLLRDVRERFFEEMNIPQNERMQKRRMAQFVAAKLEQGGFDLKIIWPGVICIKTLEQEGRCVEPGREPNPSKCQSACPRRLELPIRRYEIRAIVLQIIDDLDDANVSRSPLLKEWYIAQLRDQIDIFPDLGQEFRSDPLVRRFLEPTL